MLVKPTGLCILGSLGIMHDYSVYIIHGFLRGLLLKNPSVHNIHPYRGTGVKFVGYAVKAKGYRAI